jgi:acyl-CoA synthetase (AMP-forming)/AMP-acid ligase II
MGSTSAEEESMRDYRTHRPGTYQEMISGFRWEVPASYNLAADVLDKHEPDRPAMHFVSDEGRDEHWTFGEMRRLTDRTANTLRELGVGKGDRVAVMAPASPEIAASFLATYKCEAILLSMSVLYGDDSIAYRLNDSEAKVLVTSAAHRDRVAALLDKAPSVERLVVVGGSGDESFEELTGATATRPRPPTPTPRPSSTTPRARPAWPKGSCTPTATCSATRSSSSATTSGRASCSTPPASGPGSPGSCPASSGPGASGWRRWSTAARAGSTRARRCG